MGVIFLEEGKGKLWGLTSLIILEEKMKKEKGEIILKK